MATSGGVISTLPDASWMSRAACRDVAADALTPHEGEDEESDRLLANRDLICFALGSNRPACPVMSECLNWAEETQGARNQTGVAGGLTATARRLLSEQKRRSA